MPFCVRRVSLTLAVLLALVLTAGTLNAQSQATTGVIEGTILDQAGAPLPGVTVTLQNTDTGFEKILITHHVTHKRKESFY